MNDGPNVFERSSLGQEITRIEFHIHFSPRLNTKCGDCSGYWETGRMETIPRTGIHCLFAKERRQTCTFALCAYACTRK